MVIPRFIVAAIASAALFCHSSLAHSLKRNPLSYVTLVNEPVIKTPAHRVHSHSEFDLIFSIHDGQQKIRLALEPNNDLIHDSFAVTYLGPDGNVKEVKAVDRTEHRVFKGTAFVQNSGHDDWRSAGWARITVHRDGEAPIFDGSFRVNGNSHHIHTASSYLKLGHKEDPRLAVISETGSEALVVWRDADIIYDADYHDELKRDLTNESTCGSDSLNFDTSHDLDFPRTKARGLVNLKYLFGRQSVDDGGDGGNGGGVNVLESIGSVSGCPGTRRIALVGIATDCTYWEDGESEEDLRKHVIGMVNRASEVYESTFNISLGIRNLTINDRDCPGEPPQSVPWNVDCGRATLNDRLSLFSKWRGQFEDGNAYWSLLTKCATETAVGLAWRGQLCRQGSWPNSASENDNETIAAANVVVRTDTEWQIFAHETGHTFGAIHDCPSDLCPVDVDAPKCCPLTTTTCDARGRFMMAPSTAGDISRFSPCSIGNICSGFKSNIIMDCLTENRNVETISGSQCGNGIVEAGEDCDCGGEGGCQGNSCCNPTTCKYAESAVCDPTNESCCTNDCTFASTNTVCRTSTGVCDPEERCPGDSASCPTDEHKNDGDSCGDSGDGLRCASGQCTSRDLQCQNMVGSLRSNVADCPHERGCMIACSSDDYEANFCATYRQNFVDGTPCGAGGHCSNGRCAGTSTWKEFVQWLDDNKNIAIPVGSVIGILILIAIVSCIVSCFRRRGRKRKAIKPPAMSNWPSNRGQPVPAAQRSEPHMYSAVPNPQEQWNRSRSVRYA